MCHLIEREVMTCGDSGDVKGLATHGGPGCMLSRKVNLEVMELGGCLEGHREERNWKGEERTRRNTFHAFEEGVSGKGVGAHSIERHDRNFQMRARTGPWLRREMRVHVSDLQSWNVTPSTFALKLPVMREDATMHRRSEDVERPFHLDQCEVLRCLGAIANMEGEGGRKALENLQHYSRVNDAAREAIASASALPVLIPLLDSKDSWIVEAAVTVIFNIFLLPQYKLAAIDCGVLPALVRVSLEAESSTAREVAVGALCNLSEVDKSRESMLRFGTVPLLANVLREGSPRSRKDAVVGLFNLGTETSCKIEILRTDVIQTALMLLDSRNCELERELAALLARLAKDEEGCKLIEAMGGVPVLLEVVEGGCPGSKASAVSALLSMVEKGGQEAVNVLWSEGALPSLIAVSQQGTPRGRQKADLLIGIMRSLRDKY